MAIDHGRPVRQRFQRSQTEVVYDRYQFFTVETEVKFWRILL